MSSPLPPFVTLLALAMPTSADTLSPTERAIVRHVDAHNAEGVALLERIVNINSGTMSFAGDVIRQP